MYLTMLFLQVFTLYVEAHHACESSTQMGARSIHRLSPVGIESSVRHPFSESGATENSGSFCEASS